MPFEKGHNKSKGGLPKELTFVNVLARKAAETKDYNEYEKGVARIEKIAERVMVLGETTDDGRLLLSTFETLRDTLEGKPTQRQEITGANGEDIKVITFSINQPNQEQE
jgi:hypothetical protein